MAVGAAPTTALVGLTMRDREVLGRQFGARVVDRRHLIVTLDCPAGTVYGPVPALT